ncbi:hypothetical protein XENOCAPTIV_026185, partial [Xenoophorus captivus]
IITPIPASFQSLTVLVLFCSADSIPRKAVHVCSFSPALRLDSSLLSKPCRSSASPGSPWSLLTRDKPFPSCRCLPSADENNPSAKTQQIMMTTKQKLAPRRLGHYEKTPPSHHLASHVPPAPHL